VSQIGAVHQGRDGLLKLKQLEEAKIQPPLRASEGVQPVLTWVPDFWPPELLERCKIQFS
jgi:hypothetical protein